VSQREYDAYVVDGAKGCGLVALGFAILVVVLSWYATSDVRVQPNAASRYSVQGGAR
jgi:hypothetical protein